MTRKKRIGLLCAVLVPAVTLSAGAYALYSYNKANFSGTVVDKYQLDTPFHSITVKSNHVVIESWFGKKDFCVTDDEMYAGINVGETYSFKKDPRVNWVKIKS